MSDIVTVTSPMFAELTDAGRKRKGSDICMSLGVICLLCRRRPREMYSVEIQMRVRKRARSMAEVVRFTGDWGKEFY